MILAFPLIKLGLNFHAKYCFVPRCYILSAFYWANLTLIFCTVDDKMFCNIFFTEKCPSWLEKAGHRNWKSSWELIIIVCTIWGEELHLLYLSFSRFSREALNVESSLFKLHTSNKSSNWLMPSHFFIKPVVMKMQKGWHCWREINSNQSLFLWGELHFVQTVLWVEWSSMHAKLHAWHFLTST